MTMVPMMVPPLKFILKPYIFVLKFLKQISCLKIIFSHLISFIDIYSSVIVGLNLVEARAKNH